MNQRSWDGWISWWSKIFAFYQRNSWSRLWVARRENCFSSEQNHPEYPLQGKDQSGGNESSQRRPFPPRKTDCLPDLPTILSRIMPTCLQLFFEMMIFRNSIRNGTKFYCRWHKSHLSASWRICTNQEDESLRNSRPHWNCTTWRFIRRRPKLTITDWRRW